MTFYWASFWICAVICFVLVMYSRSLSANEDVVKKPARFLAFQRNYLVAYFLAMFADWVKGPYVYALYEWRGFDKGDIAFLFLSGFLSSMLFGTVAATLADSFGRKRLCCVFYFVYVLAALTKVSANFHVLLLGRVLSGIATSLLFSVFEAWMVCEHNARGFDPALLGDTFSKATLGNGIVAVCAGLVATFAADNYDYTGPFLAAIPGLLAGFCIVHFTWTENYGDKGLDLSTSIVRATNALREDTSIILLGGAQSLFEGAMYTFVFVWTPAMRNGDPNQHLPHGVIFAAFMVAVMIGSSVFSIMNHFWITLRIPLVIHGVAMACALVPAYIEKEPELAFMSFVTFEGCCGMFFATYGTLRSLTIPESCRSGVMSIFRLPLNTFVVVLLFYVKYLPVPTVFFICACAHLTSLCLYALFMFRWVAKGKRRAGNCTFA